MLSNDKVAIVIPARYHSSRFPGKPLAKINNKPMIQWVYEQASQATLVSSVVVATDSQEIAAVVKNFGGQCILTSEFHETGTDRIAEVIQKDPSIQYAINIQGDEPLIPPSCIDSVVKPLLEKQCEVSTAIRKIDADEAQNPNVVKVVIDNAGFALYFSRSVIPYPRHETPEKYYAHIGIYGFTREALLKFTGLEKSSLEKTESLEQLRLLENGVRIKTVETVYQPIAVDAPEDILKVEKKLLEDPVLRHSAAKPKNLRDL